MKKSSISLAIILSVVLFSGCTGKQVTDEKSNKESNVAAAATVAPQGINRFIGVWESVGNKEYPITITKGNEKHCIVSLGASGRTNARLVDDYLLLDSTQGTMFIDTTGKLVIKGTLFKKIK
ncbi:MAG: hypothetical protein N2645_14295 [Clostridia bacterium]|nr:hypothetical protein [Clostridia bacterium]